MSLRDLVGLGEIHGPEEPKAQPSYPSPNAKHLEHLRLNPGMSDQFDAKFGAGLAAKHLTQPVAPKSDLEPAREQTPGIDQNSLFEASTGEPELPAIMQQQIDIYQSQQRTVASQQTAESLQRHEDSSRKYEQPATGWIDDELARAEQAVTESDQAGITEQSAAGERLAAARRIKEDLDAGIDRKLDPAVQLRVAQMLGEARGRVEYAKNILKDPTLFTDERGLEFYQARVQQELKRLHALHEINEQGTHRKAVENPSIWGEIKRGLKRGALVTVPEMIGGAIEFQGEYWGSEGHQMLGAIVKGLAGDTGKDIAEAKQGEVLKLDPKSKTFKHDLALYAGAKLGEGVGTSVPLMLAFIANPYAGTGVSIAMGQGEMANTLKEEFARQGVEVKAKDLALYVNTYGSAIGAVELIANKMHINGMTGAIKRKVQNNIAIEIAKGAAKGAITEGVTEMVQESILMLGTQHATGKGYTWDEYKKRMIESFAGGAIPGSVFGTVGGARDGLSKESQKKQDKIVKQVERELERKAAAKSEPKTTPPPLPGEITVQRPQPVANQKAASGQTVAVAPVEPATEPPVLNAKRHEAAREFLEVTSKDVGGYNPPLAREALKNMPAPDATAEEWQDFQDAYIDKMDGGFRKAIADVVTTGEERQEFADKLTEATGEPRPAPLVDAFTSGGSTGLQQSIAGMTTPELVNAAKENGLSLNIGVGASRGEVATAIAREVATESVRRRLAQGTASSSPPSTDGDQGASARPDGLVDRLSFQAAQEEIAKSDVSPDERAALIQEMASEYNVPAEEVAANLPATMPAYEIEAYVNVWRYVTAVEGFDTNETLSNNQHDDIATAGQMLEDLHKLGVADARNENEVRAILSRDAIQSLRSVAAAEASGGTTTAFEAYVRNGGDLAGSAKRELSETLGTPFEDVEDVLEQADSAGIVRKDHSGRWRRGPKTFVRQDTPAVAERKRKGAVREAQARERAGYELLAGERVYLDQGASALALQATNDMLTSLPDGVEFGAAVAMQMDADATAKAGQPIIRTIFRDLGGNLFDISMPHSFIFGGNIRAVAHGSRGGFVNFASENVDVARLRGELAHELVHIRVRSGLIEGPVYRRLVSHAHSLGVLDMSLQDVGDATGQAPTSDQRSIREIYSSTYQGRPNVKALLDEEAVAHLVELTAHNYFSEGDVEAIAQDLAQVSADVMQPERKAPPPMAALTAYHGSRHAFDRFDSSKIGEGEGAQAFGFGLYFAESKGVAEYYMQAGIPDDRNQYEFTRRKDVRQTLTEREFEGIVERDSDPKKTRVSELRTKEHQIKRLQLAESGKPASVAFVNGKRYVYESLADPKINSAIAKAIKEQGGTSADVETVTTAMLRADLPGAITLKESLEQMRHAGRKDLVDLDRYDQILGMVQSANIYRENNPENEKSIPGIKKSIQETSERISVLDRAIVELQVNPTPKPPEGNLYSVSIDAETDELINYDKLLYEQPEIVRKAAQSGLIKGGKGKDLVPKTAKDAARLRDAGIKGVRFADASSRHKESDEGKRYNIVLFSDADVSITDASGAPVTENREEIIKGALPPPLPDGTIATPAPSRLPPAPDQLMAAFAGQTGNLRQYDHTQQRVPTAGTQQPERGLRQLVDDLSQALGLTVRQGRTKRGGWFGGKRGSMSGNATVLRNNLPLDIENIAEAGGQRVAIRHHDGQLLDLISNGLSSASLQGMYPDQADPYERFISFFRTYVVNRPVAENQAPTFFQEFEAYLDRTDPALLQSLQDVAEGYHQWALADSGGVIASSIVSTRKPGFFEKWRKEVDDEGVVPVAQQVMSQGYGAVIDDLHPIRQATDQLLDIARSNLEGHVALEDRQKIGVDAARDPWKLLRLARNSYQTGHLDLMRGVRAYRGTEHQGASFHDALTLAFGGNSKQQWSEDNMQSFGAYLISRRMVQEWKRFLAGELDNPPDKFSMVDHMQAVSSYEAAMPTFEQAADQLYQFQRNMLTKAYQAGFVLPETYLELTQREDYVPAHRDMSDKDRVPGGPMPKNGKGNIIKQFRGSKRDFLNPLESITKFTYEMNYMIARNEAIGALDSMARAAGPGGETIAERIPAHELKGQQVDALEVVRSAARTHGISDADSLFMIRAIEDTLGDETDTVLFQAGDINEQGEPIVYFWEGGKRVPIRLPDAEFGQEVYEAITGLGAEVQNILVNEISKVTSIQRAGITMDPAFAGANLIRDTLSAWMLTDNFIPFVSSAAGLRDALSSVAGRDTQSIQQLNSFGVIMGGEGTAALHEARVKRDIAKLRTRGMTVAEGANPFNKKFWELVGITETATRAQVFKIAKRRALRDGLNEHDALVEAAHTALDVMDFSRHGSRMLAARKLVTFLNASLQGLDKTRRVAIGDSDTVVTEERLESPYAQEADPAFSVQSPQDVSLQVKFFFKFVVVMPLLGVLQSHLYADDEEYQEIPEWMRNTHWMWRDPSGTWRRIPKPFELASGSLIAERLYERVILDDPTALDRLAKGLFETILPPTAIPFTNLIAEQWANKKTFTGGPIVPGRLAKMPNELQYTAYTSESIKAFADLVGVSPMRMEHAIHGIGGGFSKLITTGLDAGMNASGVTNSDVPPSEMRQVDAPVVRRFTADPARSSESKKEFWKQTGYGNGEFTAAAAGYKEYADRFNSTPARDFLKRLTPDERAWALIQHHGNASMKRRHPLTHARDMISITNGIRREISTGELRKEDGTFYSSRQRRLLNEAIEQMQMRVARNAFRLMKHPGWAHKKYMEVKPIMDELRASNPDVYEELETRIGNKKIMDWEDLKADWPDLKAEILAPGFAEDMPSKRKRGRQSGGGIPASP